MKFFTSILLSFTVFFVSGCSTFSRIISSDPTNSFRSQVDAILNDSIFVTTDAAIKIVSLDNNEVLYERNAKKLMRPASNLKLLTTSTALCVLGKDFSILTKVFYSGKIDSTVLKGNLYFKGYGDPDFSTENLSELISRVVSQLHITSIEGTIIGDATYFDDKRWGSGWMWDDEPYDFAAYNSALTINRNCVGVSVAAGKQLGDTTVITITPPTKFVSLENQSVTDTTNNLDISRKFDERLNVITIKGSKKLDTLSRTEYITIRNPELYFLTLAKEELERQHVRVTGDIQLKKIDTAAVFAAEHIQAIDSMMIFLNKTSDNLSAENTLKILGAEKYGVPGSTENGISAVKKQLVDFGIDSSGYLMVDGSGVSFYNLMTAENYIKLLQGMYTQKNMFDLFFTSLPDAGIDGTLHNRMKNSSAEKNLHAKTGTISGVSSLAGYVRTADNELLAFSIMMQNFIGSSAPFRKAQDAIGVLMAGLKRK